MLGYFEALCNAWVSLRFYVLDHPFINVICVKRLEGVENVDSHHFI